MKIRSFRLSIVFSIISQMSKKYNDFFHIFLIFIVFYDDFLLHNRRKNAIMVNMKKT